MERGNKNLSIFSQYISPPVIYEVNLEVKDLIESQNDFILMGDLIFRNKKFRGNECMRSAEIKILSHQPMTRTLNTFMFQ